MRAGLDARFACARYDGIGRYVASLLREVVALDDGPEVFAAWPPGGGDRHPLPSPTSRLRVIRLRRGGEPESPWGQIEIPRMQRRYRLGVWHSPFPLAPLLATAPLVVTMYDCIPDRFPAYFGRRQRLLYRGAAWTATRRARLVITPSQLSAEDAIRYYRVPDARLRVIPLGVDLAPAGDVAAESRHRRRLGLPEAYVLLVGRPRPHKGHSLVVRAMSRLGPGLRLPLVRVGSPDPRLPDGSAALAAELGVALHELSNLDEDELIAVYRGAVVTALPSLIEGFGLPVLEAMAAGVPVLASDIEPLRATGGSVARYAPATESGWTAALETALTDSGWRSRASAEGPARAAEFPWRQTAELTVDAWREAMS